MTPATALVSEIYRVGESGDFSGADPLPPHVIRSVHFVWAVPNVSTAEVYFHPKNINLTQYS